MKTLVYFSFAIFAALSLARCGGDVEADPKIESVQNLIRVPLARQAEDYTCGVAALQSILGFYGQDLRQGVLAAALGSNENDGTNFEHILLYAQTEGYETKVLYDMSEEDLKAFIDRRLPLIILIQAWHDGAVDWKTDQEDGHYVVAVGYDKDNFYFMDPSTLGHYTYIPTAEFLDRWHDVNKDGTPLRHFGMLLTKGSPSYNPDLITPLN